MITWSPTAEPFCRYARRAWPAETPAQGRRSVAGMVPIGTKLPATSAESIMRLAKCLPR